MKRLLIVILTCVLALSVAGCGGGGGATDGGEAGGNSGGSSGGGSSTGIASPADLRAAIDRDYADAEWYGDLTDVTLETYLGASVAVIRVAWSSTDTDYETNNRKQTDIGNAMGAYEIGFAPNTMLVTADGALSQLSSSGDAINSPMSDVYTLPAAPTTAAEVKAWLDAVYGPGGLITLGADETWYAAIQSMTMEGDELVVNASLSQADRTQVDLLNFALQTTGSPLLSSYSIRGTDTYVSGSAGSGEPGMGGLFYPKE